MSAKRASYLQTQDGRLVENPYVMGVCDKCHRHTEVDKRTGRCNLWGCASA